MKPIQPHAITVVGLAYGDCGKGTVVNFLTRERQAHTVVRFNGGPQAGHNVVTPDGRHHTFSQFGSGALVPGTRTLLSQFVLIEPYALLNESDHLGRLNVVDPLASLMIDRRSVVITPAHQAANRLRELARGASAHGTCGMGVGEAASDALDQPHMTIRAGDLSDRNAIRSKLRAIREVKLDQLRDLVNTLQHHPSAELSVGTLLDPSWIDAAVDNYAHVARHVAIIDEAAVRSVLRTPGATIFEGAQGVLLDESYGFHPHTTWSNTTFANADAVLTEAGYDDRRTRLGVLRSYFTRHGAGPFVTADDALARVLPEPHNDPRGWQGAFRVGHFDVVAARYALAVAGPIDALALTHLDRLPQLRQSYCAAYQTDNDTFFVHNNGRASDIRLADPCDLPHRERLTAALHRCRPILSPLPDSTAQTFINAIERELHVPIRLKSTGPTYRDKQLEKLSWLD
jgi:adenylosuccinate synthase